MQLPFFYIYCTIIVTAQGVCMKILIVEDEQTTARQLKQVLTKEGYAAEIAYGFQEAQDALDQTTFDLIVLDWNLGDGDGLDLLHEIRDLDIATPVIMLTANSEIDDRVMGLDGGADDYLCKPYSHIELLARMRALLRRDADEKKTELTIGDVTLDTKTREVHVANKPIEFTTTEFDLLELLMKNKNRVLTKYQLSEFLNKDNYTLKHSNLVEVHIKNIRKKLGQKEFITTLRGIGYKITSAS